jgi:hypothetical protein
MFLNSVVALAWEIASILGCLIVSHKLVDKLGHKGFGCLRAGIIDPTQRAVRESMSSKIYVEEREEKREAGGR